MKLDKKVEEALASTGAVLEREGSHLVYRLPNRRVVVISKSASDRRAVQNQLKDIRRQSKGAE